MEFDQLKSDSQSILTELYSQGIQQNEEHIKKWTQYRDRHKQIIEGLQTLSLELSMNCIVPIGKKALMKGKLKHTSEILVCIGDGYFVKYTTTQAIALCNRRIQYSEEVLRKFEQERNLLESRYMLPLNCDAFEKDECENVIEHWDDKKLEDWRVEHREKEKEYRHKLIELRSKKKQELLTEEDLFKRLDELELEEELADELDRLEEEHREFYGEYSQESTQELDEDSREESDEDLDEETDERVDEDETQINLKLEDKTERAFSEKNLYSIEEHIDPLIQTIESKEKTTEEVGGENLHKDTKINGKFEVSVIKENTIQEISNESSSCVEECTSISSKSGGPIKEEVINNDTTSLESDMHSKKSKGSTRRVSFIEPHVVQMIPESDECGIKSNEKRESSDGQDDNAIIINFTHSETQPTVGKQSTENNITSPTDIYRIFCKPKSILKKSAETDQTNKPTVLDDRSLNKENTKDITNDKTSTSTYNAVVQDVQSRDVENVSTTSKESTSTKRPMSRFKLERANIKKGNQ